LWVLARPDDPGLPSLRDLPRGVACTVADDPAAFAGGPPADAVLVCAPGRERLQATLALAPGARWVHFRSAGVDGSVYPELAERPLVVTNARGVFSLSLAEFVIAAVLHFAKGFRRLIRNQDRRLWEAQAPGMVAGRTMGIVGYGDIGRTIAPMARALGMRVIAVRRSDAADPSVDEMFPPSRLDHLMAASDVVVVATPLTGDTRGLVGAKAIAAMKRGAVLVNVGRGPVVEERALVAALQAGAIGGAALDVFETEPLPVDSPLWSLDNVLLSPHSADHTPGWLENAMTCFLSNLRRFLAGEPLANPVDPRRGY
jgi:phosphoglycerate dehydrogenase-like enzyme